MIPKIIHYCWFGRNPLPDSAVKCIKSWRKFFPDYEIKEWNEDNFDVNSIPYITEAYQACKYAFVSDYARFWILYYHGGVYFDTDVEVIKPMDDIIAKGPFMGIEMIGMEDTYESYPLVNPGLGMSAEPGMSFYKEMLEHYGAINYLDQCGKQIGGTVVIHTTGLMIKYGLKPGDLYQKVAGISIYPSDYFNPFDDLTGRLRKTENTRSIHWYAASWQKRNHLVRWISRLSHRVFGLTFYRIKMALNCGE